MSVLSKCSIPCIALLALLACSAHSEERAVIAAANASATVPAASRVGGHVSKRPCSLLTAETVSAVFGIPARQLMQMRVAGCRYGWNRPEETLEAVISLVQQHADEGAASAWFEHATGSRNAAASDKSRFEAVDNVGDAARVNAEGSLYVRAGELTFVVSAYRGAKAPSLDVKGVAMKEVPRLAKQAAAQWRMKTAPQRKQDAIALARAIVAQL